MKPLRIAIIGFGKIARDQHVPAIAANPRFELAATVTRTGGGHPGVPCFTGHRELLAAGLDLDAVSVTTPPAPRYTIARDCIAAGLHPMLEKPPGVTLGEVQELARLADNGGTSLFTTWHAQHNPAVEAAAEALAGERLTDLSIVWREDVRKWHPGQQWIWEPGGFGVFDPGINAFSIATRIAPATLLLRSAELFFPQNRQAPIAAELRLEAAGLAADCRVQLDWRHSGNEQWTIETRTESGRHVLLSDGGSRVAIDGAAVAAAGVGEYPSLYARFLDLIDERVSHVDLEPLRLAAEAFLLGRRTIVEPFIDE